MTRALEQAFHKERYDTGYKRTLEDKWPIRNDDRAIWLKWIADPDCMSDYVEGRLDGEKELRLRNLLNK